MNIHSKIKQKLLYFIKTKKIPHIIFHGDSGSGKRHIINFFINKIYRDIEQIRNHVMYVNCAHGKGIRFIRNELKFFAKMNIHHQKGQLFKSIILFNADKLTTDAQSALRRCIEQFSHTTRFFIIIDHQHRLLKPILSRFCSIYIPIPIIDGKMYNLHNYNKKKCSIQIKSQIKKRKRWLHKNIDCLHRDNNTRKCKLLADKLYEKAYSALDLMTAVEDTNYITSIHKYALLIHFDKVRREFRHDKLLLFYILVLAFMRPNCNLENIQTM